MLRKNSAIGGKSWYLNSCSLALYLTVAVTRVARLAFLKPNSGSKFFFLIWLVSQNSFDFLAFSWRFYMLKLSARKLHTTLLLNHFVSRKMFFWSATFGSILPPRVWARKCQPPTCKSAEHGGHVTRLGTVAPVCL